MAAISVEDVWAVGSGGTGGSDTALVLHWNGRRWGIVASPSIHTSSPYDHSFLYAVSALGPSDVWAVGDSYGAGNDVVGPTRTLVEHFDGHRWTVVPSANFPGYGRSELTGVLAVSPNDVWAVGDRDRNCCAAVLTLIEHWHGRSWSIVPSPNPGGDEGLSGIAALSPADVYAVGSGAS